MALVAPAGPINYITSPSPCEPKTLAVFNRKQVEDRLTVELQKAGLDARAP